ncbi:MAG: hypothetical protein HY454_04010 [Parcubacteria group bacterium]|nr:hypothetical protein [Parcubacteria group bacterium]
MNKAAINKNRLFFWAVIISVLNPIFSGLILGLVMLFEPELKKEGRIVTVFSVVWGIIVLMLLAKFRGILSL